MTGSYPTRRRAMSPEFSGAPGCRDEGAAPPVRVVHLIHSLTPGGAERVLVELAGAAPRAGLTLAVMPLVETVDDRYARLLREAAVPVLGLGLASRWDVRAFGRAIGRLRRWRPDVVHTHLKHADAVGAVAARRLGIPMVSTLHVIEDGNTPMLRFKRRVAALARTSTAARTITVSDAQRDWYLSAFPGASADRVVTIRNGVADPGRHSPAGWLRAELGVPAGAVLAATVGILRPGKGHDDLFHALRLLRAIPEVHVVVIGEGELRATWEHASADLNGRVHFIGFRDDVPALLDQCDMLVHPSHFDALPTAVIQALAAGLAVVATAVGGVPEIVGDAAGVLVPPRDPVALAEAIDAIAADPMSRMRAARAARSRFEALFDAAVWARGLRELYVEVCREAR